MNHGGVLLKPPVAHPTMDLHHYDSKLVKPVVQEFPQEKE